MEACHVVVAFVWAKRKSIHLLDIGNMTLSPSQVSFRLGDLVKQSRPGNHTGDVSFKAYAPHRRMCTVTVLREYLKRTETVRTRESQLLLTYQRPEHAASSDSIRRWTPETMQAPGTVLNIFSPHSTRVASSSRAKAKVPLTTSLRTVGWQRKSTFRSYCDKQVAKKYDF